MKFTISILEESQESNPPKPMTVEAGNWYTALASALKSMNDSMTMQNINFTVLGDGKSAQVEDPNSTRVFLIQAQDGDSADKRSSFHRKTVMELNPIGFMESVDLSAPAPDNSHDTDTIAFDPEEMAKAIQRMRAESAAHQPVVEPLTSEPDVVPLERRATLVTAPLDLSALAAQESSLLDPPTMPEIEPPVEDDSTVDTTASTGSKKISWSRHDIIPSATSIAPLVRPKSFSIQGFYMPGTTGQFLTDAFMKLANLYEHFEQDKKGAIRYVLNMLEQSIKGDGGGVILTDINDPTRTAWFEVAFGPAESDLLNLRLSLSQGFAGHCVEYGSTNITDLSTDDRFKNDFLRSLELSVGPVMYAPIDYNDVFLGVHVRYRSKGSPRFTTGEMSILEYMSQSLGEYLSGISG